MDIDEKACSKGETSLADSMRFHDREGCIWYICGAFWCAHDCIFIDELVARAGSVLRYIAMELTSRACGNHVAHVNSQ